MPETTLSRVPEQKQQKPLRRLFHYLLAARGRLVLTMVLSFAGTALALIPAVQVGRIINGSIADGDKTQLAIDLLIMLAFAAGGFLGMWSGGRILAVAAQDAMYRLRKDVFEHTQTLSLRFFDRQPIGDLMSRITNDMDSVGQLFDKGLYPAINSAFTLLITTVLMFWVSWQLSIAVVLIAPLILVLMQLTSHFSGPAFSVLQERTGALNGAAEELITGDRTVKAYLVEDRAAAKLEQLSDEARTAGVRANFVALTAMPLSAMLSNLDVALVALAGGWLSIRGTVSVGTVASFFIFARMFARPLNQFAQILNMALQARAGATRVFEILDERPEIVDTPRSHDVEKLDGHVVMDHVDFSYVPGVPILHDVSLTAKPGQKIGLVGPTGAGKSTIINVITRYYDIQAGDIRLDGASIYDVTTNSLRELVGMVLQEPYLFSDTVMANIRYARLEATDEECIAAAKAASADGFITRLPDGYDTVLSGGGSNLSQGQRQLITIARIVLANRPVLILDEATSSVDTRTERALQEALTTMMKGRTSFVIAHRLSTIRDSDVIVAINDGRVVDVGSHDELMAAGGFYHDLYMSQFRGDATPAAP
ncbi:MAG TPA: ABC transporter ATP-binding protein [Gaiellaceae bacterium]|jgi:ATP-binding cassette subfamily B protein